MQNSNGRLAEMPERRENAKRIYDALFLRFVEVRGDEPMAACEAVLQLMRAVLTGTMKTLEDLGRGDDADKLQTAVLNTLARCADDD